MLDFNIRSEDDDLFVNSYGIDTYLDCFLQEIDIIIYTIKQSILFNREFGSDIEKYLWHTNVNSAKIESMIREQIEKYSSLSEMFTWSVKFDIVKGDSRDIGVLDVNISEKQSNVTIASQKYILR